ncbi:MAG: hypothetical protein H0T60_05730 [Acidobacteria bacterium]|nr:hypothetical protein [Acidobacteriota bacterium]
MAKDESKRINPSLLEADKTSFAALQSITTYTPANLTYAPAAINAARAAEAQREGPAAAGLARLTVESGDSN